MSIAQIGLPNNPQQLMMLAQQGNVAALGKLAQLQKQAQMMKAMQGNQAMQAQEPPTVMEQTAQQVAGSGIANPVAMARGGRVRSFQRGGANAPEMFNVLPEGSWRGSQPVPEVSDDNDTSPAERGLSWLMERMGALKEGAKHAWNQKNGEPSAVPERASPAQPTRHDIRYDAPDNPRSAPSEPALVQGVVEENAQWEGNKMSADFLQELARSRDPNNHRLLAAYLRKYPEDADKAAIPPSAPSGLAAASPGAADMAPPQAASPMGPPAPAPEPEAGGLAAAAPGARDAMRAKANEAARNHMQAKNAYMAAMLERTKPQQEAWYQTLGRLGGHLAKGNGQRNQSALETFAGAAPGMIADSTARDKALRDWELQGSQLGIDMSERNAKQEMSELEGAVKDDAQDRQDKRTTLEERKQDALEKQREASNKLAEKRIAINEKTQAAVSQIRLLKAEAASKGKQLDPNLIFRLADKAYQNAKNTGLSDTEAEEASNRIRMEAYVTNNELARSNASGTIPAAAAGNSGPLSNLQRK